MTNYPVQWKTKRLEEVSDVIDPHPSHRAPAIDPNGIPFVGIGDVREDGIADFKRARLVSPKILSEHAERYSLETDLIGLGRVASVGKVVKLPKGGIPYTISPTLAVISPVEISFDFLYYALQSPQIQNQLTGLKQGSGRQSVGILKLRKVVVPFPPVDEQNKIVELLEDHLSRLNAALADVKQVKIKAAQFRRSLLQAAFTGNLDSDETRLMNEWQTKTVGEITETQLGKMLNKGKQSGKHSKPYLRTDNVHWGRFDLSEIKEMDILPEEHDKYLATKGDLLMCEGGASGRTAIWNEDYDISFQNHVHRIRPKNPREILPKFLLYYFEWFIKNGYASDLIKGVTISSLSQSGLRSIEVTYPPIDEQHEIVELLEDHLSRLDASVSLAGAMEKQSTGLRRSLLQAAFTGQLTKEVVSV